MSLDETPEETKEKATVLSHIAKAEFPANHLAPWMSKLERREAVAGAALRNVGDIPKELKRRAWWDDHPQEELPEEMESSHPNNEDGDEEDAPEFETDRTRGGADMFGWCVNNYAQHFHDLAVSIDGLGRRQGIGYGSALKSGQAVVPQKRSLWDKVTGKNKEQSQVATGGT